MDLTKPTTTGVDAQALLAAVGTLSVNVGVPGNIKKVQIDLNKATVRDAIAAANLNPKGYDIRVSGNSVGLDSNVTDGQTILLLRPVVGNIELGKPGAAEEGASISVNVGVPGNIKKVVLAGKARFSVGDVLAQAGMSANGYEVRVSGNAVTPDSPITDGQTILLLRPVRGNN